MKTLAMLLLATQAAVFQNPTPPQGAMAMAPAPCPDCVGGVKAGIPPPANPAHSLLFRNVVNVPGKCFLDGQDCFPGYPLCNVNFIVDAQVLARETVTDSVGNTKMGPGVMTSQYDANMDCGATSTVTYWWVGPVNDSGQVQAYCYPCQ